jgi:hypothetical protein
MSLEPTLHPIVTGYRPGQTEQDGFIVPTMENKMTDYQKAFLLRFVDSQIDQLMQQATKTLPNTDQNPEAWYAFWEDNQELFEQFVALYKTRNIFQVMETE